MPCIGSIPEVTVSGFDIDRVRAEFPALALAEDGRARLYLDAPGGTQVPARVILAMTEYLVGSNANDGGAFRTSVETSAEVTRAHAACAALLGAETGDEIVFGLNMTSLAFQFSRMLARDWRAGDEIVLTRMDHDANIAPWLIAAEERSVTVRWLDFDAESFAYRYDTLGDVITPRTRFVAVNHASNLLGTINDVTRIARAARDVGAIVMVDAVQSAPHLPLDVAALGCDMLGFSAYKLFGPHAGIFWVRRALLDRLTPLKVRPAPWDLPHRFETGTPSFEAQAGTRAAIEHLAWLGDVAGAEASADLRSRILAGMAASKTHEDRLMRRFLDGARSLPGFQLFGIASDNRLDDRVPTFSFRLGDHPPERIGAQLAAENIFVWAGSFYAYEAARRLGTYETGGLNRIGLAHYNTEGEVDRVLDALDRIARG